MQAQEMTDRLAAASAEIAALKAQVAELTGIANEHINKSHVLQQRAELAEAAATWQQKRAEAAEAKLALVPEDAILYIVEPFAEGGTSYVEAQKHWAAIAAYMESVKQARQENL